MTWHILDVTNVLALCYTYWCHDKRFDVMELFDNMIHFLTSWRTFWRNFELYDVMVCCYVLLEYSIFNAMTSFLSSCQFLTYLCSLFQKQNIMKTCFWYYNTLLDVMICFSCHDKLFEVMTCFYLHDKLFSIMTYFWLHDTFWHHDIFFTSWQTCDVMTNLLTSWCVFGPMTKLVTSWQTLWRQDKLCDVIKFFFFIWW